MNQATGPISLHPENPRYFLYQGRPRVLITATEHYGAVINHNFDYRTYLAEAAGKAATLSRCFLLFRELQVFDFQTPIPLNPHSPCKPLPADYVAPFLRAGPGFAVDGYPRFDLDQPNPEFFERLHGFLDAAAEHDIVVELTLFSCTYTDAVWNLNPFNVRNNVNGVGDIAWQDYNSMRDPELFARQVAYVRQVVQGVNRHDNIYFEVCNEPFAGYPDHATVEEVDAWQNAIRGVVREEEARLPKQHLVFQVPVYRWRSETDIDGLVATRDVDAINMHDYLELCFHDHLLPSLARFMQRDLRLQRISRWWITLHEAGKPVVFDEDNSASNGLDEQSWIVHRKRAWAVVCSGGHYDMIDFSIQAGGGETGTPAARATIRTWLRYLSEFIHATDFVHATPLADLCRDAPPGSLAMALVVPGREYVIYVVDRREVDEPGYGEPCGGVLSLDLPEGRYRVRLYSPESGAYVGPATAAGGGALSLALKPFAHDLVVHITAEGGDG